MVCNISYIVYSTLYEQHSTKHNKNNNSISNINNSNSSNNSLIANLGPRWGQNGPKTAQDGPKMAPTWPKMGPRGGQDGLQDTREPPPGPPLAELYGGSRMGGVRPAALRQHKGRSVL